MDERQTSMNKARFLSTLTIAVMTILLLTAGDVLGTSPTARTYHQMTYDSKLEQVVMYGGQTGYPWDPINQSFETWLYQPETDTWTQMFPTTSPDGYAGGDMAYSSKADRSILSVITSNWSSLQTWGYDANMNTWEQLADGPYAMLGQRIVYDSESDRIIMFGGFELTKYKFVDETWVYDYNTNTWTNMEPRIHPSGRNYVGMVYNSKADRVILWGDWKRNYTPAMDESVWTYDYNTNTWQEYKHKNDGPAVRDYMMLAYDEKADKVIMYGGYEYGNDETWIYDLNSDTWQQVQSTENPGMLSRYAMVYAKNVNKTILFGGQIGSQRFVYSPDTWYYKLKSSKWINASMED